MKNIRPTGLQGKEQIERMKSLMGGAKPLNENIVHSKIELTKLAPDNKVYGIVRENHEYYIKTSEKINGLTLEDFQYIGGLANKKSMAFESYAKALRKLNLKMISLNEQFEGDKVNVFENDNLFSAGGSDEEETIEENYFDEEDVFNTLDASASPEQGLEEYGSPARDMGHSAGAGADELVRLVKQAAQASPDILRKLYATLEELGAGAGRAMRETEINEFTPPVRDMGHSAGAGADELARLIGQAVQKAPELLSKIYATLEELGAGAGRAMREADIQLEGELKVKAINDGPKELKGNSTGDYQDVTAEPDDAPNDKSTGTEKEGPTEATPKKTVKESQRKHISILNAMDKMDAIVESLGKKKI